MRSHVSASYTGRSTKSRACVPVEAVMKLAALYRHALYDVTRTPARTYANESVQTDMPHTKVGYYGFVIYTIAECKLQKCVHVILKKMMLNGYQNSLTPDMKIIKP